MANSPLDQSVRNLELPQQQASNENTANEKSITAFSDTKGWEVLKEALERKIEFYKEYTIGGAKLAELPEADLTSWIRASSTIVKEFKQVIEEVEHVSKTVRATKNS